MLKSKHTASLVVCIGCLQDMKRVQGKSALLAGSQYLSIPLECSDWFHDLWHQVPHKIHTENTVVLLKSGCDHGKSEDMYNVLAVNTWHPGEV